MYIALISLHVQTPTLKTRSVVIWKLITELVNDNVDRGIKTKKMLKVPQFIMLTVKSGMTIYKWKA